MVRKMLERAIAMHVYDRDNNDYMGLGDIELPEINPLTGDLKGAGLAGELEMPIFGFTESLEMTINWRDTFASATKLLTPGSHLLDMRVAVQQQDAQGQYDLSGVKITAGVWPKSMDPGKLEVGESNEANSTFEVHYLKIMQDGKVLLEIDKLNYKYVTHGVDHFTKLRQALGME